MSETPVAASVPHRRYRYEIDVIRILTFVGVVSQHIVLTTAAGASVKANGTTHLLHFTREAFFTLTAFVLVYSTRGRKLSALRFYRRRFGLVIAPYLIWNVAYAYAAYAHNNQNTHQLLGSVLNNVETGYYHLYFMFVIFQIYLLFPLVAWLLEATRGRHLTVFVVSGAIEFAMMAFLHSHGRPAGTLGMLYAWCQHNRFFVTYQFYVVAGALAATHFEEFDRWIRRNRTTVLVGCVIAAITTEYWFALAVDVGQAPGHAAAVFQPVMVFWNIAVVMAMYAVGSWWAERRRPGPFASSVQWGSDISFGVYLCHIMVIFYLLPVLHLSRGPQRALGQPWDALLSLVITLALGAAFTTLALRTPLSRLLVGRAQKGPLVPWLKPRVGAHSVGAPARGTAAATQRMAGSAATGAGAEGEASP